MNLIETHAHIYADEFREDVGDVLARAEEKGVNKIYMPNIDHTSIDAMLELEHRFPQLCVPMMGLHPCYVKKGFEKELYIVEDWLAKRPFAAVGEIGIDLYWDTTFRDWQEEAFKVQVAWALRYKRPVVIHCRNSFAETIALVEQLKTDDLKGVFHCFTGTAADAKRVTDLGFYLGIGGVATFKNGGLTDVLPEIDLAHIVLETDCPYLAPVPHRGKRNEPAYLALVAQKVADLKNVDSAEVAAITTANALRLFAD